MNRTQKILVGAALPAILAVGVVAGVAFAQMPDDHHRDKANSMQMGQMMDSAAMQDHMKMSWATTAVSACSMRWRTMRQGCPWTCRTWTE